MTEFIACVLIVEDKDAIHHLLRASLTATEYADLAATSGQEALATMAVGRAALIALELSNVKDIKLIGRPGDTGQVPVMLFAMHEAEIPKLRIPLVGIEGHFPERDAEQDERVQEGMRLPETNLVTEASVFRVRDLSMDKARRLVKLGDAEIHLTPTEYELLSLLVADVGKVVTHEQLLHTLWGANDPHTVHLLRVNISNLRRKLKAGPTSPRYITTEPSIGYRLRADS
jgi:two-component system KDP operon response regulator KdpE